MYKDFSQVNGQYSLRPLKFEDMEPIRRWRNAQLDVLRQQKPLSREQQEAYWQNTVAPSYSQSKVEQLLLAFIEAEELIGYGGVTHIDWVEGCGEVSFLLNPKLVANPQEYRKKFGVFLEMIKTVAFDKLGLKRLYTETYDIRPDHISELELRGFRLEKRLSEAVEIQGRLVDSLIHGCKTDER